MKFVIIMFICSAIEGNKCQEVQTTITHFQDHYDCAVYGYDYSHTLISNFNREFVNKQKAYIQFACKEDLRVST